MSAVPAPGAAGWPAAAAHPWRFAVLILPYGASNGFLTVAMAYLLNEAGVAPSSVAGLIALSYLPHTWKFFWAPVIDLAWRRKAWYLLGSLGCAAGTWATGALPPTAAGLTALAAVVLATNVCATVLGMALESLMAHATPPQFKGRVGGWFQAGNLGGLGVGGGAALWMVQSQGFSAGAAGATLGAMFALCGLALRGMPEPVAGAVAAPLAGLPGASRWPQITARLREIGRDLWGVLRARRGALAVLVCFLPIGSGAAANLWSVVAQDWQASANTVALVSGTLGGVVSATGCLAGGLLCDRMDRQRAYCLFGALIAGCALAMGLSPRNETSFIVFATVYAFIQGLTYAGFSALVLEAIGQGAAATKYNLLASLSNMPIGWVTWVDGLAYERWGPAPMLFTDAATGAAGLLVFGLAAAWAWRGKGR